MSTTEQTAIILCHPDESRNIGSVCRAMKNMNFGALRIVGDKTAYNAEQIRILSVHAFDIWERASFYPTLAAALSDCTWTVGTTRRRGKNRKGALLLPEEFAAKCATLGGMVGVVFGNERTGLTDEELSLTNMGVTIPSNGRDGSLNLSHAVQIICYQLFRAQKNLSPGYIPVTQARLGTTVGTITESLQTMGFFKIAGKDDMARFWRDVLSRAALSEGEATYIEKTFSKAAGLFSRTQDIPNE